MLGKRINELRLAFSWNQVQLAEKLNVSKQTISNWENDNIQPSIEMLMKLAKLFNVSTDYLLGLDSVPRLDISEVPITFVAHLSGLIDAYKNK